MTNVTVNLPDELKAKMSRMDYVNWSAVIRSTIEKKILDFELSEKIASRSRFSQADLLDLMKKVDDDFRKEGRRLLDEAHR
ncbi:MAG TPA: hypothetical protein VI874_00625 [Candidatus Norongarragalinales archaeon]|nr:hypothetical protein [Candidatus Norongarragalinales archaeon]